MRQLAGQEIEIHGPIKDYDGRAEIILERLSQLHGEAARIPPLPKEYDVEHKGKFSAGKMSHPKTSRTAARKKQAEPASRRTSREDGPQSLVSAHLSAISAAVLRDLCDLSFSPPPTPNPAAIPPGDTSSRAR